MNADYDSAASQRFGLFKFAVPTLPAGDQVTDVKLRVNVVDVGASTAVYATSSTWTESTTWNTRPSVGAKLSATTGSLPKGLFTYSLGTPLSGSGTFGFAIVASSDDGTKFSSRTTTRPPSCSSRRPARFRLRRRPCSRRLRRRPDRFARVRPTPATRACRP